MAKGVGEQETSETATEDQTKAVEEEVEAAETADQEEEDHSPDETVEEAEDSKEKEAPKAKPAAKTRSRRKAKPAPKQEETEESADDDEEEETSQETEDSPSNGADLAVEDDETDLKERLRRRLEKLPVKGRSKAAADPTRFDPVADEVSAEFQRRETEIVERVRGEMNAWAERDLTRQLGEFEERIGTLIHQQIEENAELIASQENRGTLILREEDRIELTSLRDELEDVHKSMKFNRLGLFVAMVLLVVILLVVVLRTPTQVAPPPQQVTQTTTPAPAPAPPPEEKEPAIVYDDIPPKPQISAHFESIAAPTPFLTVLGINESIFREELTNLGGSVARNRSKLAGPGGDAFVVSTMYGPVRGVAQFSLKLRDKRPVAWIASYASGGDVLPPAERIYNLWLQMAIGAKILDGELGDANRKDIDSFVANRVDPTAFAELADALELGAEISNKNIALVSKAFKLEEGSLNKGLQQLANHINEHRTVSSSPLTLGSVYGGRALNLDVEFLRSGSPTGLERWFQSTSAGKPKDVVLLVWLAGNLGIPSSGGEKGRVLEKLRSYPRSVADITANL